MRLIVAAAVVVGLLAARPAPARGQGQPDEKIGGEKRKAEDRRRLAQKKLSGLRAKDRPPVDYVARDVCPFECCVYREWSVLEDVDLVAEPGSKKVVGRAPKGTNVAGLTGEVHLEPAPMIVVHPMTFPQEKGSPAQFRAGEIFFLLQSRGEGFFAAWHKGRVVDAEVVSLLEQEYCPQPGEKCWAEFLYPPAERKPQVWWVKVRLGDGTTGWSDRPQAFGDKDACG